MLDSVPVHLTSSNTMPALLTPLSEPNSGSDTACGGMVPRVSETKMIDTAFSVALYTYPDRTYIVYIY